MQYTIWDKETEIPGVTISDEQREKATFLLFTDDEGEFLALECVDTLKVIYGFTGETPEAVAAEYIAMKEEPAEQSMQEKVANLQAAIDFILQTM